MMERRRAGPRDGKQGCPPENRRVAIEEEGKDSEGEMVKG